MNLYDRVVLITGMAGFIGFNLAKTILKESKGNTKVIGFDNMNSYYDVSLKEERLRILYELANKSSNNVFIFLKGDLSDKVFIDGVFKQYHPDIVVNLAAQAGVRYSITNPEAYIQSNIIGFFNILEACRHSRDNEQKGVEHLIYASSSSVYGSNKKVPYSTTDQVDHPVSLYAATKKSDELLAYSYAKLYEIPMTGLRFFTVYGPLGRPDMAYFGFTNKLIQGEKIQIYNYGDMYRDFTYIDDIIKAVLAVIQNTPKLDADGVPYKLYNIGNSHPESLMEFVEILEKCLMEEGLIDKTAEKELLPMQQGDVYQTYADVTDMVNDFGFKPETSLNDGLMKFVKWYKAFYFR